MARGLIAGFLLAFALTAATGSASELRSSVTSQGRPYSAPAGRGALSRHLHFQRYGHQFAPVPAFIGGYGEGDFSEAPESAVPSVATAVGVRTPRDLPPCQEVATGGVLVVRGSYCSHGSAVQ